MQPDFQVFFDNFDLNSIPYFTLTRRFPNNAPDSIIVSHKRTRADGEVVVDQRFGTKNIPFTGFIVAPSRTSYEQTMDILKYRLFTPIERPLMIVQSGSNRIYTATLETLSESHIEGGKTRIDLEFKCGLPFGRSGEMIVYDETVTLYTKILDHVFVGSALSKPLFTFTLTDITDGDGKFVGVGNQSTTQQVSVLRDWIDGDVVVFNTENKRAYLNGTEIDYNGVMPEFDPGQSPLYVDSFSARSINANIVYAPLYL